MIDGEFRTGGQEHFYLECNACVCVPDEGGAGIRVLSSTQGITKVQTTVAAALCLPYHRVQVRAKRLGGGFGGKETRGAPLGCVAAIAAHKLRRPVRLVLDRDVDMLVTGQVQTL